MHRLRAFGAGLLAVFLPLMGLTLRSICGPLDQAVAVATRIASGDLASRIEAEGQDEPARLMRALADMQGSLRHLVGQVRESSGSIELASAEVASGNTDLSRRTELAASHLQRTASAMDSLTDTVRQSTDAAHTANQLATSAAAVAARGGQVVGQVVSTMDDINTRSRKIADIIGVIDGIAFQTNILALNAAVEAARAGEQNQGIVDVKGAIGEVDQMTQQNAALVEESAAAAESLKVQAVKLAAVVSTFRLAEGESNAAAPASASTGW
jgi:methyl-accepting chemotaxis protein